MDTTASDNVTGNGVIRAGFAPLSDLPCWQVTGEFGSYLTFHFGAPRVTVHEPCEAQRHQRLAGVDGEYQLWIEMCHWVAFQDGTKLAHNESDRESIRRAAATLQGQKLLGFQIRLDPVGGEFVFDLGGRLTYQRYDSFDPDDALWNFSVHRNADDVEIASFTAAGHVSLFMSRGGVKAETKHACEDGWIHVQQGAAPNGGPATPIRNSGVVEGPPSVS